MLSPRLFIQIIRSLKQIKRTTKVTFVDRDKEFESSWTIHHLHRPALEAEQKQTMDVKILSGKVTATFG